MMGAKMPGGAGWMGWTHIDADHRIRAPEFIIEPANYRDMTDPLPTDTEGTPARAMCTERRSQCHWHLLLSKARASHPAGIRVLIACKSDQPGRESPRRRHLFA